MKKEVVEYVVRNILLDEGLCGGIYDHKNGAFLIRTSENNLDLAILFKDKLLNKGRDISIYTSHDFLLFGYVKIKGTDNFILAGPAKAEAKVSDSTLRSLMADYNLDLTQSSSVASLLKDAPQMDFATLLSILYKIYVIVNDEIPPSDQYFDSYDGLKEGTIPQAVYKDTVRINDEEEMSGADYSKYYEDQLVLYIQSGNPDDFEKIVPNKFQSRTMLYDMEDIRQYKDRIISCIAIVSRASIEAGLDTTTAYKLNDIYINKIERSSSIEQMNIIVTPMFKDFCSRVGELRLKKTDNPTLNRAMTYINEHLREKLSTSIVADAINVSQSYLSIKFKKATGMNFTTYINQQKVEEAKRLLRLTDKPLTDISNYLSFSSQSYFQNIFRKQVGITPLNYRNKKNEETKKAK
ncbi:MAG: AraC family transcriptional regulator [Bacilli bacterium]|jgi:YesN/AraC family two-component response regulator|nr:AraC family transcriptional regulator [Bacilli bacterium]